MNVFEVGEDCWLAVAGHDIFPATVTAVEARVDPAGRGYTTVAVEGGGFSLSGLPTDDSFVEKEELAGAGDGKCAVMARDPDFPDQGFADLVAFPGAVQQRQQVAMRKLNDCELVHNLKIQFDRKECYCWCGPTLVAVNISEPLDEYKPGGGLAHVFATETMNDYQRIQQQEDAGPHIYALGALAFNGVNAPANKAKDQAIVITGESGAGKSFTTKKLLGYLAHVGASQAQEGEPVTKRMLDVNEIIEAFGHANMPRNPDSSRFGKLFKIYFGNRTITGCEIVPYMLEKARVSGQQPGERNFHVFYQLLAHGPTKTKYGLGNAQDYLYTMGGELQKSEQYDRLIYTRQMEDGTVYDFEDDARMGKTLEAMRSFFSEEYVDDILRITAGTLELGNVEVEGTEESSQVVNSGSHPAAARALQRVAELWQVDLDKLVKAITVYTLVTGAGTSNEKIYPAALSAAAAARARDTIARAVYDEQFSYMVAYCSKDLVTNADPVRQKFVGVLDIFGFEFTQDHKIPFSDPKVLNSFEQFCINLCNEQLQWLFVEVIFELDQLFYKAQIGHEIDIDFPKNVDTLDLIQASKGSIMRHLDDVTRRPPNDPKNEGKADAKFYSNVERLKHNRLGFPPRRGRHQYKGDAFQLEHYASVVTYDIRGWVDKNADKLSPDILDLLSTSGNHRFIAPTFKNIKDGSSKPQSATIASDFKGKLKSLMDVLYNSHTNCKFVRCIKASNPPLRNVYTNDLVLTQLKYTGMLATLEIRRRGYAMRKEYQDFCDHYHVLSPHIGVTDHKGLVKYVESIVPDIVNGLRDKPSDKSLKQPIVVGRQGFVLARDWLAHALDIKRHEILGASGNVIQATYRGCVHKNRYRAKHHSALTLGPMLRAVVSRKRYYLEKRSRLDSEARTKITLFMRAQIRRYSYAVKRVAHFEKDNRHLVQNLMHATVVRQAFFEKKLLYIRRQQQQREMAKMMKQLAYAREYQREARKEAEEEAWERLKLTQEDNYVQLLEMSKVLAEVWAAKEVEMDAAEEARQQAAAEMLNQLETREYEYAANQQIIEDEVTERIRQTMRQMGMLSEGRSRLALPPLAKMPNEYTDSQSRKNYFRHTLNVLASKRTAGLPGSGLSATELHQAQGGENQLAEDGILSSRAFPPAAKEALIARVMRIVGSQDHKIYKVQTLLKDL